MSKPFHLAIPAGDLDKTEKFYTDILGCKAYHREKGKYVDIDFWGNELTLHKSEVKLPRENHKVDMGTVTVPHFGVHLKKEIFEKVKSNIEKNNVRYLDKPYTRYKGTEHEQNTFFIQDPNGNILELKTLKLAVD